MAEAKPFASLTSSLLARKGQAKPAMRPQAFGHHASHDDLGWNDMGHGPRPILVEEPRPYPARVPEVVRQQEEIAQEFASPEPVAPAPLAAAPVVAETPQPAAPEQPAASKARVKRVVAPRAAVAPKPVSKATGKARAAFTLRLDPDRHLKLRLACAVTGRSAQQIVTEALEDLLKTMPEVEAVAGQLPARAARRQQ